MDNVNCATCGAKIFEYDKSFVNPRNRWYSNTTVEVYGDMKEFTCKVTMDGDKISKMFYHHPEGVPQRVYTFDLPDVYS